MYSFYYTPFFREEWSEVADKLTDLGRDAPEYYVTLETESHRDAWSPLMLLFLWKINQLTDVKVKQLNLIIRGFVVKAYKLFLV